jgi:antitoxin component of MazEF toxin-antitoxin module
MNNITILQDDITQDLFIEIPQEILKQLNWGEGTIIDWQIKNESIIISKIQNTIQSQEESIQTNYDWYTIKETYIQDYIQETNTNQSIELSQNRDVPLPTNFPHFP